MRRLLALVLSTPLALAVASPAAAEEHEPAPIEACGGELTIEEITFPTRFKEIDSGFQTAGNAVVRVSVGDSSVVLRLPGRARGTFDPETGTSTTSSTGQTLLLPTTEALRAAIEAAGLPELAVIRGRVVLTEEFDPETGEPSDAQVVSFTPKVTDVCALLAD